MSLLNDHHQGRRLPVHAGHDDRGGSQCQRQPSWGARQVFDVFRYSFAWNAHQFLANQNVLPFLFTIFIKTNKPSVDSKTNVVE